MKKIRDLSNTPGFEGREIYGATFELWTDTIRNIVWTFGGEFFGPGGYRDVTLDSPNVQEALEMMPVEAVARGYLTGSGLIDYQNPEDQYFSENIPFATTAPRMQPASCAGT